MTAPAQNLAPLIATLPDNAVITNPDNMGGYRWDRDRQRPSLRGLHLSRALGIRTSRDGPPTRAGRG